MHLLTPALVFEIIYEGALKDRIPYHCKRRLYTIQESDIPKIPTLGIEDKSLGLLYRHYPLNAIAGLCPVVYHNVALDVHRREKECKWTLERDQARISFVIVVFLQIMPSQSIIHKLDEYFIVSKGTVCRDI